MKTEVDSSSFYENLPILNSFFEVSRSENYHSFPDDWYIGLTDIVDSTEAIKNNQYKTVNILGASPIVGLKNELSHQDLPFSFGGDGCTLCFSSDFLKATQNVFAACIQIGKKQYDLNLRGAIIPISYLKEQGCNLQVARFRISEFYNQAVFIGDGINYAEKILKSKEVGRFHITAGEKVENVDFSGLECRWQEVKSPNKSVTSLLVQCNPALEYPAKIYDKVLKKLRDIYGFDENTNPLKSSRLKMNMSIPELMAETKFRTFGQGWFGRLKYIMKSELQILLGKFFMYVGYVSSETDWKLYKPDLALNSDHRKFTDMLSLVISGTIEQHQELEQFLTKMYEESQLAYGIHHTDAAIVTCMVFAYHRQHIHFVDGSDGGYVMASRGLKKRLKALQSNE